MNNSINPANLDNNRDDNLRQPLTFDISEMIAENNESLKSNKFLMGGMDSEADNKTEVINGNHTQSIFSTKELYIKQITHTQNTEIVENAETTINNLVDSIEKNEDMKIF